jgi:hypothetical protein
MLNVESISTDNIIGKFRKVSPAINDYISREMYIHDAGCVEAVNLSYVIHKCLDILLDELLTMGIVIDVPMECMMDNVEIMEIAIMVRDVMSTYSLTKLFKQFDITTLNSIENLIEPYKDEEHPSGLLLPLIIEKLYSWYPTHDQLQVLCYNIDRLISTDRYVQHVSAILASVKVNGNPSTITDNNLELINKYLKHINKCKIKYSTYVKRLMAKDSSLDRVYLIKEIDKYNDDLLRHPNVYTLARAVFKVELTDDEKIEYASIMQQHKIMSKHHLEHYLNKNVKLSNEDTLLVLCDSITSKNKDVIVKRLADKGGVLIDSNYLEKLVKNIDLKKNYGSFNNLNMAGV